MERSLLLILSVAVCTSCAWDVQPVGERRSIDGGAGGGGSAGQGGASGFSGSGGSSGMAGAGGTGGNFTGGSCAVATEDEDCGGKSCNPVTLRCSQFGSGERGPCKTCDSDDNCWSSLRCVPMYFGDDEERHPDQYTGFCLPMAAFNGPGGCNDEAPYVVVLEDRESLSGEEAAAYCGVHEHLTTCDAVEAQLDEAPCTQGRDDECPVGGICRYTEDNGKWDHRCTYFCTSNSECRNRQGWTLTCIDFCGA